ncbi:glycosyltransferase family 2 protein [Methylomonas rhizoryzae]|uniref:glycosyltransferase family 2 protein n=1 Tax=Methylomonas rhizoryzae TaxID=2608981 RepID=UPI00123220E1|nr:glycosyltransferase [Methylomonas rhizoryzae]
MIDLAVAAEFCLPTKLTDLLELAFHALEAGNLPDALAFSERACQLTSPPQASALLVRANTLIRLDKLDLALADYCAALQLLPTNLDVARALLRACCLDRVRYRDLYRRTLTNILRLAPQLAHEPEVAEWVNAAELAAFGCVWRDGEFICGWAVRRDMPSRTLQVEIDGNFFEAECSIATPGLQQLGIGDGLNGFRFQLPDEFSLLRLGIAGVSLWGCPIQGRSVTPAQAVVQTRVAISEAVDVVVPVYGGRQETLQCIQSVLSAKTNIAYRIVVVDDCSPDPQLGRELRRLASDKKIILLLRPINAGFSGAVNTGASLDDNRDLVLLNADTQVFDYWLDRLHAAAYQSEDIGTVTPLSNFGELVSYPQAMKNNPVGDIRQAEQLDALLRVIASERVIDLPAGVGFCMYIKRVVWHRVGGLDEFLFGRGYGEDTDLCLRVRQAGWRNVCAANTYVVHWGSKSFGAEKAHLVAQNLPKLYAKYPGHEAEYDHFLNTDPLGPLRRQLQRTWLAQTAAGSKAVLTLSPTDADDPDGPRFELNAVEHRPGQWRLNLKMYGITGLAVISYDWPEQGEQLQQDLLAAGFSCLHISGWADWPARPLDFLTNGFLPYRLRLDDYSAYCPRRYRLQEQATACADPADIAICQACVHKFGPLAYGYQGMDAWLSRARRLLGGAEKITALNDEIGEAHSKRFPELAQRIDIDKPARSAAKGQNRKKPGASVLVRAMRVAVFGQASSSGYYRLQQQVKNAWERQIDVQWFIFGHSISDNDLRRWPNVHLVEVSDTADIIGKLELYHVQAIAAFADDEYERKLVHDVAGRLNIPLLQETHFTH